MASNSVTTLKSRNDYLNLKSGSKKSYISEYSMIVFKKNNHGYLRVGWTIPGKVEKAFIRNRFKRWLRFYFKDVDTDFLNQSYDLNVIFRKSKNLNLRKIKYDQFKESLDEFVQSFRPNS